MQLCGCANQVLKIEYYIKYKYGQHKESCFTFQMGYKTCFHHAESFAVYCACSILYPICLRSVVTVLH